MPVLSVKYTGILYVGYRWRNIIFIIYTVLFTVLFTIIYKVCITYLGNLRFDIIFVHLIFY